MHFRVATAAGFAFVSGALTSLPAVAGDLPAIKLSSSNKVMPCATPGRMMAFLKARNEKLDPKFAEIATDYMRHGEELGMRWDYAFFQMLLETGNLKFGGDVKPAQNNFAGLGATGNGEHGETFPDVSTGVRAHLEHLAMYSGEKVANPVAERTRKVQEWGVLTAWQKTIKGPMTFAQLAKKWAPPARKYAAEIEQVSENFSDGACKSADPHPEMVAAARAGKDAAKPVPAVEVAEVPPAEKTAGTELAKRANDEARAEGGSKRSALGAAASAKAANAEAKAVEAKALEAKPAEPKSYALLNAPKPEVEAPVAAKPETPAATKVSAGASAKGAKPAATSCKVFQASYGGAKTIIIKAATNDATQYTVLDVNEGSEAREADAYIAAYAPGGKQVGEFKSQASALDKAFELCPEG